MRRVLYRLIVVLFSVLALFGLIVYNTSVIAAKTELVLLPVPKQQHMTSAPAIEQTIESEAVPIAAAYKVPEPTPIPEPGEDFYDCFFDGGVFIGDSITQGLQNYVTRARVADPTLLGDARFAAAKSFSLKKASTMRSDGIALQFRGKKYSVPDILKAMEAKKVFIMLGVNDWAGSQIENCIGQYSRMIDNIREVTPYIEIYVESCTPITKSRSKPKLNNQNLDEFNEALKLLCQEKGVYYIDISTALKDENNALKPSYSSDKYVHMSAEGASVWVAALYQFVYDEYAAKNWYPLSEVYWDPEINYTGEDNE